MGDGLERTRLTRSRRHLVSCLLSTRLCTRSSFSARIVSLASNTTNNFLDYLRRPRSRLAFPRNGSIRLQLTQVSLQLPRGLSTIGRELF